MAAGMVIGGHYADRLSRRSPDRPLLFCMATALATGLAYLVVLSVPDPTWAFAATFLASLIGALGSPTNVTVIQNICSAELRATAAALATLTISLIGIGLAPFAIGVLSDAFTPSRGVEALRHAMMVSLIVSLPTAVLYHKVAGMIRSTAGVHLPRSAPSDAR
jgi:MFS family permease